MFTSKLIYFKTTKLNNNTKKNKKETLNQVINEWYVFIFQNRIYLHLCQVQVHKERNRNKQTKIINIRHERIDFILENIY